MKTIFTKIIAFSSITLLLLSACKKDQKLVTSNGGKPGELTIAASTIVLSNANAADSTVSFTFTQPSFGFAAVYTNTLQIDQESDNWANPASFALNPKLSKQSFTTNDFNALLLKLNLTGGTAAKVSARIVHSLGPDIAPVYSNVLSLTVTPYNLTSWLYVVGQFNGYSTATPDSIFSATSNGIYTGIINFPVSNNRFLVLPKKNYDNKYATTESPNTAATSLTYATEYVTGGGSDLYAPAAGGNYLITLDINKNTITVEPANAYSAIGSTTPGGDYSTDLDLKFVNSTDQDWEAVLPFTAGAFKIRQNHDWTWSWGIPKAGTAGVGIAGTLNDTQNDNIAVDAAGNYKVTFTIPVTPKTVATPAVTATYTLTKQ